LANSVVNLVNSASTQVKFRGMIKSRIDKSNACYELMNPSLFVN